jgi:hypothetical protein
MSGRRSDGIRVVDMLDRAETDVLAGGQVVAGEVLEDHRDPAAHLPPSMAAVSVPSQAICPAS